MVWHHFKFESTKIIREESEKNHKDVGISLFNYENQQKMM